jgi:hypothetical protein
MVIGIIIFFFCEAHCVGVRISVVRNWAGLVVTLSLSQASTSLGTLCLWWGKIFQRFCNCLLHPQLWVFSLCCVSETTSFHAFTTLLTIAPCYLYSKNVSLVVEGNKGSTHCYVD